MTLLEWLLSSELALVIVGLPFSREAKKIPGGIKNEHGDLQKKSTWALNLLSVGLAFAGAASIVF